MRTYNLRARRQTVADDWGPLNLKGLVGDDDGPEKRAIKCAWEDLMEAGRRSLPDLVPPKPALVVMASGGPRLDEGGSISVGIACGMAAAYWAKTDRYGQLPSLVATGILGKTSAGDGTVGGALSVGKVGGLELKLGAVEAALKEGKLGEGEIVVAVPKANDTGDADGQAVLDRLRALERLRPGKLCIVWAETLTDVLREWVPQPDAWVSPAVTFRPASTAPGKNGEGASDPQPDRSGSISAGISAGIVCGIAAAYCVKPDRYGHGDLGGTNSRPPRPYPNIRTGTVNKKGAAEDERALVDLCLKWCSILWLPDGHSGARLDDRDQLVAERIARVTIEQPRAVKPGMGRPSAKNELPRYVATLSNMLPWLAHHPRPGMGRIRHYAFHVVVHALGAPPYRVFQTICTYLYGMPPDLLRKVPDGRLTSGERDAGEWVQKCGDDVERTFCGRIPWPEGRRYMREAQGDEPEHMQRVLNLLWEDLVFLGGQPLCSACEGVLRSRVDRRTLQGRQRWVAEHLIACTACGGLPRLVAEVAAEPVLKLHVPSCIPLDERDGPWR